MQADLGVPVWRHQAINHAGDLEWEYANYHAKAWIEDEPGIWHPTSPADLAAMRERIANLVTGTRMRVNITDAQITDAVMAAIFGSSATQQQPPSDDGEWMRGVG